MIPQNNMLIAYLRETIQRLFAKSPKFFMIWTIVSSALVLLTGLPDLLSSLSFLHITIPNVWDAKVTSAVAWASRAALFMSLLTTQSKPASVTADGVVLKKTDEKVLPFTAAVEVKKAQDNMVANSTQTLEQIKK